MERVFSGGRIVLSHVRNALSPASTRALLCLGQWSRLDLVRDNDLEFVAKFPEIEGDGTDGEFDEGWDVRSGSSDQSDCD